MFVMFAGRGTGLWPRTEPETPFQALEEASAKSSALRLRSETQMAEAPSRGSASQEE